MDHFQFDSSYDRSKTFDFTIGVGEVIPGWDLGVLGYPKTDIKPLRVGGMRMLYVPAKMGYGDYGAGDKIPPNADLIFQVELVAILD